MDTGVRVFSGNDTYHSRKAYGAVRKKIQNEKELIILRDEQLTERAFEEALQGSTLFGEMPAVAVERLTSFTGDAADRVVAVLTRAAAQPCSLMVWEEGKLNMRTKIGKALTVYADAADTFSVPEKPWEREPWAKDHVRSIVRELGGSIESHAVDTLVSRIGVDAWAIASELKKLVLYAKEKNITADVVCKLVPQSESNVFSAVRALASGNTVTAVRELAAVRSAGEDPRGILALTIRDVRMLMIVRDRIDAGLSLTPKELIVELGLKSNQSFVVKKIIDAAKTVRTAQLRRLFDRLVVSQYALNIGRADPDDVLDGLALFR